MQKSCATSLMRTPAFPPRREPCLTERATSIARIRGPRASDRRRTALLDAPLAKLRCVALRRAGPAFMVARTCAPGTAS
jgi:hypothetical protein